MKVYQRYLAKEIYSAVGLVLAAFLMLFAFFDFINELQSLGRGSYQLRYMALFVLLTLPGHIYELAPIAVLIGTLYALTMLARHSEITVLRASGLSTGMILGGLTKMGLAFVLLTFIVGDFVAPPAERAAKQLRLRRWIRWWGRSSAPACGSRTTRASSTCAPCCRTAGSRTCASTSSTRIRSCVRSPRREGEYLPPDKWRLSDVAQTVFEKDRAKVNRLPEAIWQSAVNPEILGVLLVMPERMSVASLYRYIRHLKDNQARPSATRSPCGRSWSIRWRRW
jgi:lipopolysaccharide export system permease protein